MMHPMTQRLLNIMRVIAPSRTREYLEPLCGAIEEMTGKAIWPWLLAAMVAGSIYGTLIAVSIIVAIKS